MGDVGLEGGDQRENQAADDARHEPRVHGRGAAAGRALAVPPHLFAGALHRRADLVDVVAGERPRAPQGLIERDGEAELIRVRPDVARLEWAWHRAYHAADRVPLEAGAEDVTSSEDGHEIWTAQGDLHEVANALTPVLGEPEGAKLAWRPQTMVAVDEGDAATLFKLIDALDDDDDVQTVWGNYDVPDEELERLG